MNQNVWATEYFKLSVTYQQCQLNLLHKHVRQKKIWEAWNKLNSKLFQSHSKLVALKVAIIKVSSIAVTQ